MPWNQREFTSLSIQTWMISAMTIYDTRSNLLRLKNKLDTLRNEEHKNFAVVCAGTDSSVRQLPNT